MDDKDYLILRCLYSNPNVSLMELRNAIMVRSVATVHNRIKLMEEAGLITPPPRKKMARSRMISTFGKNVLLSQGLITGDK